MKQFDVEIGDEVICEIFADSKEAAIKLARLYGKGAVGFVVEWHVVNGEWKEV